MSRKNLSVNIHVFPASEVFVTEEEPVAGSVLAVRVKDTNSPFDKCTTILLPDETESLSDNKVVGMALRAFAEALQEETKYE